MVRPTWHARLLAVALLVMAAATVRAGAEVVSARVTVRDDWLYADVTLRDLLDPRTVSTVESGLSGTCTYRVALLGEGGEPAGQRVWRLRLGRDLWEDQYLVSGPDGDLRLPDWAAVDSVCTHVVALPLAPLLRLEAGVAYQLAVAVEVQPLAPDEQDRLSQYLSRRGGTGDREEVDLDLGGFFGRLFGRGRAGHESVAYLGEPFRRGDLTGGAP